MINKTDNDSHISGIAAFHSADHSFHLKSVSTSQGALGTLSESDDNDDLSANGSFLGSNCNGSVNRKRIREESQSDDDISSSLSYHTCNSSGADSSSNNHSSGMNSRCGVCLCKFEYPMLKNKTILVLLLCLMGKRGQFEQFFS